jgi:predicted peroxiredoxin
MRSLVIKCTAGADEPERCNQAFTVAAAGVAAGARVSLWLTGEAAWFAVPGRAEEFELDLAAPLAELRDTVLTGGILTVCSQCAARRGLVGGDLLPDTRIAGAAVFTEEVLADGAQALVY